MALLLVCGVSCRDKVVAKVDGPPADSAKAPLADPATPRVDGCREVSGGRLLLGRATGKTPPAASEDAELELPFSVELGTAHAGDGQLGIGGIESRAGENHALIALIDLTTGHGKSLELGRVFGDVEPPALVFAGRRWLTAVADSDAAGGVLKLSSLAPSFKLEELRRGAELTGVRRDASGFAFEGDGPGALLAWTKLEQGKARLSLAMVDPESATVRGTPLLLPSSSFGEPEAPRLVLRPAGYYLTYIVRGAAQERPRQPSEGEGEKVESFLDDAPSAIEIVPLDVNGAPLSSPRRITAQTARVIAFDVVATPDGGALVVYRNEPGGPGLDPPQFQVVSVAAGGTIQERSWELGASVGLPSLLRDLRPRERGPWAYIGLASEQGTRLGVLAADPLAVPEFLEASRLGDAELLAALNGRILQSRARGTQRELALIECAASRVPGKH